jgi:AAA domain
MAISLSSLRRGPLRRPPRIVLMGTEGVGKSTWANSAPNPVFIQTEDGLDALDVNASFEMARSLPDVIDAISALIGDEHSFRTVVIDTADWLEHLIHRQIAAENNTDAIEKIPYGKGYKYALEEWRKVLEGLDLLRNEKEMIVIILAHVQIKRFEDPIADAYDRYLLDLHNSAASLLTEWCDVLGFAAHAIATKTTDAGFNKKITRGVGSGERILHLEERPGFTAKNRYGLPPSIAFPKSGGWSVFETALNAAQQPAKAPAKKAPTAKLELAPQT